MNYLKSDVKENSLFNNFSNFAKKDHLKSEISKLLITGEMYKFQQG